MIEYTGTGPVDNSPPLSSYFKTISILRIGAGLVLMYHHGWAAAWSAYEFLWKEKPWPWLDLLKEAGIPQPHLAAPALAVVVAAVALSWITGFLTRLFSLLLIGVLAAVLMLTQRQGVPAEAAWLYLFIAATLTLFGSGAISLDGLFHLGQNWSKPKKKGWQ